MRRLYVRFGFCFEHNTLIGLPCEAAMVSKAQGCWPQAADPGHLLLILVRQSGIRTNCMLINASAVCTRNFESAEEAAYL
eukprot:1147798-Pelagomonas_calceolata.AAC.4